MKYRKIDKYKYQSVDDESIMTPIKGIDIGTPFITLYESGLLVVYKKYAWNGSNWSSDKKSRTASFWHDVGYQLMRLGLLGLEHRKYFDQLYRDILIKKGLWKIHANIRYQILRLVGKVNAKPTGKKENVIFKE